MSRQTQHRVKREEQRAKEISDYKQENRVLKRQVARLRKQLETVQATQDEAPYKDEEPVEPPEGRPCPACDAPLKELKLGPSIWMVCQACKFRQKE